MRFDHPLGLLRSPACPQLRMNYIADAHAGVVTCKHGDLECSGNAQQLCVQRSAAKWEEVGERRVQRGEGRAGVWELARDSKEVVCKGSAQQLREKRNVLDISEGS